MLVLLCTRFLFTLFGHSLLWLVYACSSVASACLVDLVHMLNRHNEARAGMTEIECECNASA
jgi:hypothetical protein